MNNTTIDPQEVEKFSRIADEWWDPNGKFKPLHQINPTRILYIREHIEAHYNISDKSSPFKGLNVLDIGCGGGLVSVPFARLGANITGIDASEKNIKVAKIFANKLGLDINYLHSTVEALKSKPFDVILALEILEHIADIAVFFKSIEQLLKNDGLLIISTINRTVGSYLKAIIGAEYILRWLPIGTHDFGKFLKPSEINTHLSCNNIKLLEMKGLSFSPINCQWNMSEDISVNYFMIAKKGVIPKQI